MPQLCSDIYRYKKKSKRKHKNKNKQTNKHKQERILFSPSSPTLYKSGSLFARLLRKLLECLYGQQGFCGFCISITSKNEFQCFFALRSSFKFPASATPNEVDRVMEDWGRMTSLQANLKASCVYFTCLTTALFHQLHFVCFLWTKTPNH